MRHTSDMQELADTGVAHLRLDDRHAAALEARAVFKAGAPLLAERQGAADAARDKRLPVDVLWLAGRLSEVKVVRLELANDADCLAGRELPVQVDHQVDVGADGLTQRRHLGDDVLFGHRGRELDPAVALADPLNREVAALRQCRLRQARHIGRECGMAGPAEQAGQGTTDSLAEQVPDRDVDTREAVDIVTAEEPAYAHEIIEILMDHDWVGWIATDDGRPEHVVDDRLHGLRRNDPVGFAPSDQTAFAGDLHQHGHVGRRIDRAVALADQIALGVDRLALLEGAEIGHVAGDRDNEGLDPDDGVKSRHGLSPPTGADG